MNVEITLLDEPKKNIETLLDISKNNGWHPVAKWWLEKLLSHDIAVLLAKFNDLPVGFAVVSKWFKYEKYGIELDVISVRKEYQGKGIGSLLMKNVFEIAKNLGKKFVYLFVSAENRKAIRFYTKLGFKVCGFLADRYGEGKHSIIMRAKVELCSKKPVNGFNRNKKSDAPAGI